MKFWQYSGQGDPGVFSYDDSGASGDASDDEESGGEPDGEDDIDEDMFDDDDDIVDEDTDVDEGITNVQLSSGEFSKYEITEPGVLERRRRRWKRKCETRPLSDDEGDEAPASIEEPSDVPVCGECGRLFSSPAFKDAHVCKVQASSNRSLGARIPRVAVELMNSGTIMMDNISEVDVLNAVPSLESLTSSSLPHSFIRGWARRPKQGKRYGDTFVARFKADIAEMFEQGERERRVLR
jgi:hypothetical protein